MATNPLEAIGSQRFTLPDWARSNGVRVDDLRNNPYWGPQEQGDGSGSLGSGDGGGYYGPLNQFAAQYGGDGSIRLQAPNPAGAMDWLASSGQQLFEASGGNNENARWLQDAQGNITAEPQVMSMDDDNFWTAAMLAAAVTGANLYDAYGVVAQAGGVGGAAPEAGIKTLGTIAPGSGPVAPLAATGLEVAPALGSVPAFTGAPVGLSAGEIAAGGAGLAPKVAGGAMNAGGAAGAVGSSVGNAAGAALGGGMDWSDWAKIGTTLVGAGIQSNAANKAVDAQAAGTDAAIAEQRRQFDQMRADNTPYREAGTNALSQFQTLTNTPTTAADVMQDPGYQFGLDQGQQAIDRKVAAMGGRVSGQAIKAAGRFGTNYATTGFTAADQRRNDRLNRLASLAGIGQSATNASASAGSAMANNISGLVTGQGNATGGGILAQGNIWGNTANQIAALYGRGNQQTGSRVQNPPVNQYGP